MPWQAVRDSEEPSRGIRCSVHGYVEPLHDPAWNPMTTLVAVKPAVRTERPPKALSLLSDPSFPAVALAGFLTTAFIVFAGGRVGPISRTVPVSTRMGI